MVKVEVQKTNPQNLQQPQPQNLQQIVEEVIKKYIQNLQQPQQPQPQNLQQQTNEFVVKSNMKASYVALKLEQLMTVKRSITLSALGFAMPIAVDSVFLVKKDMSKLGKQVSINNIELFEKEFISDGSKKIVSGVRITLQI